MFATGNMIKNVKVNNIEYGIKHINKIYMRHSFKTARMHVDSECEGLCAEMDDLASSLNFVLKKEHVPNIEQFNRTVK